MNYLVSRSTAKYEKALVRFFSDVSLQYKVLIICSTYVTVSASYITYFSLISPYDMLESLKSLFLGGTRQTEGEQRAASIKNFDLCVIR